MKTYTITRTNQISGKSVTKTVTAATEYEAERKVVSNYLMANAWYVSNIVKHS